MPTTPDTTRDKYLTGLSPHSGRKKGSEMSKNEILYEAALDAITELFSDTSVDKDDARSNMQALIEHIKELKESLR